MAMTYRNIAGIAGLALLAACATSTREDGAAQRLSGTNVTRIHLGGDIARGEVAVEPRFETQAAGGVYEPAFAAAVAGELRTLGFAPAATPASSEFVATVDVATGTIAALSARTPAASVSAVTAATPDAVATQLAVQLKRRSDGSIVWEGRAQSATRGAPNAGAVRRLATALFRDFPGESGRTINVR